MRHGAQETQARRKKQTMLSRPGQKRNRSQWLVGERDAWCRLWRTPNNETRTARNCRPTPQSERAGWVDEWVDGQRRDGGRDTQKSKTRAPGLSPGTANNLWLYSLQRLRRAVSSTAWLCERCWSVMAAERATPRSRPPQIRIGANCSLQSCSPGAQRYARSPGEGQRGLLNDVVLLAMQVAP